MKNTSLNLRKISDADASFIQSCLGDQRVNRYYGIQILNQEDLQNQMDWYRLQHAANKGVWWIIVHKDVRVGAVGFNDFDKSKGSIEIGIWIHPSYWNKGFASLGIHRAIEVVNKLFDVKVIEAFIEIENQPIKKLLSKVEFNFDSHMKNQLDKNGRLITLEKWIKWL